MKKFVLRQIPSIVEGFMLFGTIALAENGYHWTAFALGFSLIIVSYNDGQYGWSQ